MPVRKVTDPSVLQQLNGPLAPNPMFPGQLQGQGLNNEGQQLTNQRNAAEMPYVAPKAAAQAKEAQINAGVAAATAPAEITQKAASARQSTAQAATTEANLQTTGGAGAEQAKSGSFYTRAIRANNLYAQGGYDQNGKGEPTLGRAALKAVLPDSWVNQYTSPERQSAETLQEDFIRATLRYESGANIPETEIAGQRKIFFPQPGDSAQVVALKAQLRRNAIDGLRVAAGPSAPILDASGGTHPPPPADAPPRPLGVTQSSELPDVRVDPQSTIATTSMGDVGRSLGSTIGLSHAPTRNVFDPQTAAGTEHLIRAGRPMDEIAAWVKSRGYDFTPQDAVATHGWQNYLKSHPGYKGRLVDANRPVPMTVGETVAGSPIGATGSAMGTAATAGFNDEIAGGINKLKGGSYTEGRNAFSAKKNDLAEAHPYADLAGTAIGATGTMGAIGKAGSTLNLAEHLTPLARYGQTAEQVAGIGARRAATLGDIGYSTAFGAGQNNENRLAGAGEGALAGYGGNLAGRAAAKTLGGLISPTGGKLADLYAMGVRPSIGQRAGGLVNNFEEKFQSLPFVGDAIQGTRQRARDQFQVGLFNDALGEIGQQLPKGMPPGHAPHAFAQDAFSKAYDTAERGMTVAADGGLATDLGNLQHTISTLRPESQGIFNKVWNGAVGRRFASGTLAGPAYKDAMSELSKKIAAIRKNPQGDHELAAAFEEAQSALRASATRNSPPEAVAALDAADRGYAKLVRIENASKKAGGDAATFTPKQYNSAVKESAGGIRSRGYLSGNALNSDIAAQGLHLGDVVSNSGTFDRYAPLLAMGAGFMEPKAAIPMGLYGLANAPLVRNLTTGLMTPRGGKAKTLADLIRKQSDLIGTAGSGVGLGLLSSQ